MENMTEQQQLEKEIEDRQKRLHDIRWGDIDTAYKEFEDARDKALEKYNLWKEALQKHGQSPNSIMFYFNTWRI
jgi:hypothetical protein